jgi:hypothetical protein
MIKQFFFDEVEHKYYDSNGVVYTSMTTVLQSYEKPFNKDYWSVYSWYDRYQPEHKVRPDDNELYINWGPYKFPLGEARMLIDRSVNADKYPAILLQWDRRAVEAQTFGTNTHNFIENEVNLFYQRDERFEQEQYFPKVITYGNLALTYRTQLDQSMLDNSKLRAYMPDIYRTMCDYISKGYILYAEVRMYDEDLAISGTCDLMAKKGDMFDLIDWKTNAKRPMFESGYYRKVWNADRTEKIDTGKWVKTDKRFKEPISHIQQCKGNGYNLQLSGYANLLERKGLHCDKLALVHIARNDVDNPTLDDITGTETIWLPYMKAEIEDVFNHFSRRIKRRFL